MPGPTNLARGLTGRGARMVASKVPEVTALFWIIKVLTTGMGETASDYLTHRFDPVIAAGVAAIVLLLALVLQFSTRRYVTWIYWLAVAMVSVFGTMAADALHVGFGVPYAVSSAGFALILALSSSRGIPARRRCRFTALPPDAGRCSTGQRFSPHSRWAPPRET